MYSMLAKILMAIDSDPDPGFLSSLEQCSGEAERLHERFRIVQGYYRFVSVYETRPHRIKSLGVVSNMIFFTCHTKGHECHYGHKT